MHSVTLRGQSYSLAKVTPLKLVPLLSAMGVDANTPNSATLSESERQKLGEQVLARLQDPMRHSQVAFSLKQVFPTIPNALLDYWVEVVEGDRRERFVLELSIEEIGILINAAMAAFKEHSPQDAPASTAEEKPQPPARGFAPTPKLPAIHPEEAAPPESAADILARHGIDITKVSEEGRQKLRAAGFEI